MCAHRERERERERGFVFCDGDCIDSTNSIASQTHQNIFRKKIEREKRKRREVKMSKPKQAPTKFKLVVLGNSGTYIYYFSSMLSFSLQKDFCKREMFFVDRERCPKDEYTQSASFEKQVWERVVCYGDILMENFHREMLCLLWVSIGYVLYIFFKMSFFLSHSTHVRSDASRCDIGKQQENQC